MRIIIDQKAVAADRERAAKLKMGRDFLAELGPKLKPLLEEGIHPLHLTVEMTYDEEKALQAIGVTRPGYRLEIAKSLIGLEDEEGDPQSGTVVVHYTAWSTARKDLQEEKRCDDPEDR